MLKPCVRCGKETLRRKFCSTECFKLYREEYRKKYYQDNREHITKRRMEHYYEIRILKVKNIKYLTNGKFDIEKYLQILKEQCKTLIGDKCIICNSQDDIVFHEKHFKRHSGFKQYYLDHSEDFIPLCRKHHTILHNVNRWYPLIKKYLRNGIA